jgi:integrase
MDSGGVRMFPAIVRKLRLAVQIGKLLMVVHKTSTERIRVHAWESWTQWCVQNGHEPFAVRTALAEYLRWLVDPDVDGGGHSAASAYQAYWAVRSGLLASSWRDPARDPTVRSALAEIRALEAATKSTGARRLTREEIESITAVINIDGPRGLRDRALIWLGHEGSLRPGQLVALRWRHVERGLHDTEIRIIGRNTRNQRLVTLYEGEEPLAAFAAWRGVRRRGANEPVFSSIPWNDARVSTKPLSTSDVSRVVQRRAEVVGLSGVSASSIRRTID